MKILKKIISFFKSLFTGKKTNAPKVSGYKRKSAARREPRLSNKEKIYNWLSSTGYTPKVNPDKDFFAKKESKLSHYAATMIKAKKIGAALRKEGKIISRRPEKKNKYGLDVSVYT